MTEEQLAKRINNDALIDYVEKGIQHIERLECVEQLFSKKFKTDNRIVKQVSIGSYYGA